MAIIGRAYKIDITFTEQALGTAPKNKKIYDEYIASKAPEGTDTTDEVDSIDVEKIGTGYHMVDGRPCLFDYMVKGYFKDAVSMLLRSKQPGLKTTGLKAHKKTIDGLVFVKPRLIQLVLPEGTSMDTLERPLRAQTAQGERIALARSETVPAGTTASFTVHILGEVSTEMLEEWLSYGEWRGIGQWRNAGFGAFTHSMTEVTR